MSMVEIWLRQNVYLMEFCAGLKLTTVNSWAPMCAHGRHTVGHQCVVKYATYYYSANREECYQVSCTNMNGPTDDHSVPRCHMGKISYIQSHL